VNIPDLHNYWVENDVSLRPNYPFKPRLEIQFLSDFIDSQIIFGNNVFEVPYNFIQSVNITTYPYPKADITLADTKFTYIEQFAFTALTLYNEIMRRVSRGLDLGPFGTPAFCKLRWGWEGTPKHIMSNWIKFTLAEFEYNITGTWLEIRLQMLSSGEHFFSTQTLGSNNAPVKAKVNGKEVEKARIADYIITMLSRFGLQNEVHYVLDRNEWNYEIEFEVFKEKMKQYSKPQSSLLTWIHQALNIQLTDDPTMISKKITHFDEITVPAPKGDDSSEMVKQWRLRKTLDEKNVIRVYEWRDTPTSVITNINAQIPKGYFLGYADLSFLGLTIDDNGNIARHYVKLGQDDQGNNIILTYEDLEKTTTTKSKAKRLIEANVLERKVINNLNSLSKTAQMDCNKYADQKVGLTRFIKKYTKKTDMGKRIYISEDSPYYNEIEGETISEKRQTLDKQYKELRKKYEEALKECKTKKMTAKEDLAKTETMINKAWEETLKRNTLFKVIDPMSMQEMDVAEDYIQDRNTRNKLLTEKLLQRIADDIILRLNITVIGDPWLDGYHMDFANDKVRIVIRRPDGEDSILTNDYFFLPEVTHQINQSGYTTSMTLMTSRRSQYDKLKKVGGL